MDKNSYNTSTHTTEQNSHANQCDPNNLSYHSNRGENNNGTTQKTITYKLIFLSRQGGKRNLKTLHVYIMLRKVKLLHLLT